MLEQYWKIGHSYYGEFNDTFFGRIGAQLQYWMLPPCHKAGGQVGDKILVGSFSGASKVQQTALYHHKKIADDDIEGKIAALKDVMLEHGKEGQLELIFAGTPVEQLAQLERGVDDYLWKSLPD
ncbi:hypothetical protein ACFL96_12675 [Thermoproteota archaeon]